MSARACRSVAVRIEFFRENSPTRTRTSRSGRWAEPVGEERPGAVDDRGGGDDGEGDDGKAGQPVPLAGQAALLEGDGVWRAEVGPWKVWGDVYQSSWKVFTTRGSTGRRAHPPPECIAPTPTRLPPAPPSIGEDKRPASLRGGGA